MGRLRPHPSKALYPQTAGQADKPEHGLPARQELCMVLHAKTTGARADLQPSWAETCMAKTAPAEEAGEVTGAVTGGDTTPSPPAVAAVTRTRATTSLLTPASVRATLVFFFFLVFALLFYFFPNHLFFS